MVRKGDGKIVKILLMAFQEDEENLLDAVLSTLENHSENCVVMEQQTSNKLLFKGLEIDYECKAVRHNNKEIGLTYFEFEILSLLARNCGKVFSKEQIYDIVWNEPYFGDYNIITSHIHNIREKIEDDPRNPLYIQTVWGVGYRFNKDLSSNL